MRAPHDLHSQTHTQPQPSCQGIRSHNRSLLAVLACRTVLTMLQAPDRSTDASYPATSNPASRIGTPCCTKTNNGTASLHTVKDVVKTAGCCLQEHHEVPLPCTIWCTRQGPTSQHGPALSYPATHCCLQYDLRALTNRTYATASCTHTLDHHGFCAYTSRLFIHSSYVVVPPTFFKHIDSLSMPMACIHSSSHKQPLQEPYSIASASAAAVSLRWGVLLWLLLCWPAVKMPLCPLNCAPDCSHGALAGCLRSLS
jgi:hypothetical protein